MDSVVCLLSAAALQALADITNEHERLYNITKSQLITGTVPLASTPVRGVVSLGNGAQYMASGGSDASSPISSEADPTNFGTYSYNITRRFNLLPKSIKTFPFLSTTIIFNYTLETTVYLSAGTSTGLFQRIFTIEPSEFLPAGTVTFYLAATGITLGQGRLTDTPKRTKQRISLANDPDVKFQIINIITSTRQVPTYGQDLSVDVTISNRKDKQTVSVTLTINSGYRNTNMTRPTCSSSRITIDQDVINRSSLIIRATIEPNQNQTCAFTLSQSN